MGVLYILYISHKNFNRPKKGNCLSLQAVNKVIHLPCTHPTDKYLIPISFFLRLVDIKVF